VSYHPKDAIYQFCAACNVYVGDHINMIERFGRMFQGLTVEAKDASHIEDGMVQYHVSGTDSKGQLCRMAGGTEEAAIGRFIMRHSTSTGFNPGAPTAGQTWNRRVQVEKMEDRFTNRETYYLYKWIMADSRSCSSTVMDLIGKTQPASLALHEYVSGVSPVGDRLPVGDRGRQRPARHAQPRAGDAQGGARPGGLGQPDRRAAQGEGEGQG
jgi:hypothetical protein